MISKGIGCILHKIALLKKERAELQGKVMQIDADLLAIHDGLQTAPFAENKQLVDPGIDGYTEDEVKSMTKAQLIGLCSRLDILDTGSAAQMKHRVIEELRRQTV